MGEWDVESRVDAPDSAGGWQVVNRVDTRTKPEPQGPQFMEATPEPSFLQKAGNTIRDVVGRIKSPFAPDLEVPEQPQESYPPEYYQARRGEVMGQVGDVLKSAGKSAYQIPVHAAAGAAMFPFQVPLQAAAGMEALTKGEGMAGVRKRQEDVQRGFTPPVGMEPAAQEALGAAGTVLNVPRQALGAAGEAVGGDVGRFVGEIAGDLSLVAIPSFLHIAATKLADRGLNSNLTRLIQTNNKVGLTAEESASWANSMINRLSSAKAERAALLKEGYTPEEIGRMDEGGRSAVLGGETPQPMPLSIMEKIRAAKQAKITADRMKYEKWDRSTAPREAYNADLAAELNQRGLPPPPGYTTGEYPGVMTGGPNEPFSPELAARMQGPKALPPGQGFELVGKPYDWDVVSKQPAPSMTPPPASGAASGGALPSQGVVPAKAGGELPPLAPSQPIRTEKAAVSNQPPNQTISPDLKDKISDLYKTAVETKVNKADPVSLGKLSAEEADLIKNKTGLDVSGYERTIDLYGIRHVHKKHGDPILEAKRGQVAITREDLNMIPEITSSPDNVEYVGKTNIGRDTIRFTKRINGETYYVEEVRTGRKTMALVSMWKVKAATSNAPSGLPPKSPSPTSETLRSLVDSKVMQTDPEVKPKSLKSEAEQYGVTYKGEYSVGGKKVADTFTDKMTNGDFSLIPGDDLKAAIVKHRKPFVESGNIPASSLNLQPAKESLVPRIIPHEGAGLKIEYLQNGEIVGTGQLVGKDIPSVHVKEEFRRQGFGTEIMKDLISRGGERGYPGTETGKRMMANAGMKPIGGGEYGLKGESASVPFMLTNEMRTALKDKGLSESTIRSLTPKQAGIILRRGTGTASKVEYGRPYPKQTEEQPFPKPGPVEEKTILDHLKAVNEDLGQSGKVDLSGAIDYVSRTKEQVKYSGDLQNDYYRLKNKSEIDRILTKRLLESAKGKPADYKAIYDWIEDPKEPLTPRQKELYDTEIEPIRKERNALFSKLRNHGVPVEGAGYVPRFVAERGGFFDRLIEGIRTSSPGAGLLRKTAQSFKPRVMKAIVDAAGNRKVVAIKNGEVFSFKDNEPVPIGKTQVATPKRTEWFDEQVMNKLNALAKDLGIKHERVLSGKGLGGSRLGVSFTGANLIKTKHATPEDVIIHEIGHQLDDRYGLWSKMVKEAEDVGPKGEVTKKASSALRGELQKELRALADLRYENHETSEYYKKYVRKKTEKIAVLFQAYLHAPEAFRSVAPKIYGRFTDFLRSHPETRPIMSIKPSLVYESKTIGGVPDYTKFIDNSGKKWTIGEATTKEIEANTKLKYHKNALLNEVITYNELKKVDRAIEYLDNLMADPRFEKLAIKLGTENIPKGYKTTVLPQLRGYAFPDRIAETLDTFYKHVSQGLMEPSSLYSKVNSLLRSAIFFNPLIHIPNITVHAIVNRGTAAWLNPMAYPKGISSAAKAIRATLTMNDDYLAALDKGAGLLYSGVQNKNLYDIMFKKMGHELTGKPALLHKIATALGYVNPAHLVKAVYHFSSQATWSVNDVATLQAVFEEMSSGKSMDDAIGETAKHIPNYRIPPRVMNSTTISKLMKGETGITMFGAYHYGALKSYGEMVKSLLGNVPLKERASALDKLAMLGIITLIIYPILDEIAKQITGKENVKFRRAGASTFPHKTAQLLRGEIEFPAWVQSVLTPSIGLSTGMALYMGHDPRTGIKESPGEVIKNALAPVGLARRIAGGKTEPSGAIESLFGISKAPALPSAHTLRQHHGVVRHPHYRPHN